MMWRKISNKRIGWAFIIISTIFWLIPFAMPFLSFSTTTKVGIAGVAVVIAEVLFWLGTVIIGKDVVEKYRKSLFKWKKRDKESDQP
jgi:type III secretory pathway component EscU